MLFAGVSLGSPSSLGLPSVAVDTGISNILNLVFTIAGAVAVGFIVYGAVQYVVSGGDPAGTKRAKDTVLNSVIGLVITLIAFGIVNFVTKSL